MKNIEILEKKQTPKHFTFEKIFFEKIPKDMKNIVKLCLFLEKHKRIELSEILIESGKRGPKFISKRKSEKLLEEKTKLKNPFLPYFLPNLHDEQKKTEEKFFFSNFNLEKISGNQFILPNLFYQKTFIKKQEYKENSIVPLLIRYQCIFIFDKFFTLIKENIFQFQTKTKKF